MFHFDLIEGSATGYQRIKLSTGEVRTYPYITSPGGDPRYVELFARVDGGEIKRIALWSDPFVHGYVIYQEELFKANVVEIITQYYNPPPGKPIWSFPEPYPERLKSA